MPPASVLFGNRNTSPCLPSHGGGRGVAAPRWRHLFRVHSNNGSTAKGLDAPTQMPSMLAKRISSLESQLPKAPQRVTTSRNAVLAIFSWPAALAAPTQVSVAGSFNRWQEPIPLRQSESGGDFVRSVVLPPGLVTYKFIVDGDWQHSPRDPVSVRSAEDVPNNQRIVVANAVFNWRAETVAEEVYVTGSFVNWQELVPLQGDASGGYYVNCCLPAGKHYVQFLVDGEWFVSPDLKQEEDETGRLCNSIEVNQMDSFHLFYKTDWPDPSVKWRHVSADGQPMTEWQRTEMTRTQSRAANWLTCTLPSVRGRNNAVVQSDIEFVVEGPHGRQDLANSRDLYRVSGTGGYKLDGGVIKPFPQACAPPILLVSDLDGTMVGETREADAATASFTEYWEQVAALCQSVLVYNTGRSIGQFVGLFQHKRGCMALPDAIITAVGTKVFFLHRSSTRLNANGDFWVEHQEYARMLDQDWDLNTVRRTASEAVSSSSRVHWLDDGSEHPHRIALNVHHEEVERVKGSIGRAVAAAGYQAQFVVSGIGEWRYLDILSIHGGKMKAMEYVRRIYDIKKERVLTAGDSGNDILMLEGSNPAVVVGNAQPALLAWTARQQQNTGRVVLSDKPLALGVLEGLARHGLY